VISRPVPLFRGHTSRRVTRSCRIRRSLLRLLLLLLSVLLRLLLLLHLLLLLLRLLLLRETLALLGRVQLRNLRLVFQ